MDCLIEPTNHRRISSSGHEVAQGQVAGADPGFNKGGCLIHGFMIV